MQFEPRGDKSDWAQRAGAIVELGYPAVADHLAEILVWVQDMNWPGSTIIAEFLVSIGEPMLPAVKSVLNGNDGEWQYNILTYVVNHWPKDLVAQIEAELMDFSQRAFDFNDLDIEAFRLMAKHKLGDSNKMQHSLSNKISVERFRLRELEEIEQSLLK